MSVQYWPKTVSMELNFGQISVLLESENTLYPSKNGSHLYYSKYKYNGTIYSTYS